MFYIFKEICVCAPSVAQSCPTLQPHELYLSMGFPRQEYWSGLLFSPPGDLPNLSPRVEPESLAPPALADGFFTTESPGKSLRNLKTLYRLSHQGSLRNLGDRK